jgi:hypothetical protein
MPIIAVAQPHEKHHMSDTRLAMPQASSANLEDLAERDEAAEVPATLRALAERSTHLLVRACLQECLEDIVHLTSCA